MAVGTKSDFAIYQDEFFSGAYEIIEQNLDLFNDASRGAIRLFPEFHRGDFLTRSFFKNVSGGLIARRDTTATTGVTSAALTMDDAKSPKVNRRIGPVEDTIDAFKKINEDPSTFSFILGQQIGPEMFQDIVNTAIAAAESALDGVAALEYDGSAATITTSVLTRGLGLMGDRSGRVICWVMHSKAYWDLVREQIGLAITNVSDVNISSGAPITLARPVIVTDSASLIVSGSPDNYLTLGLVADGVVVRQSEEQTIVSQQVTGSENITMRIQGEFAYTLTVKGFDFTGAANPTDAVLGNSANWSQVASDEKSCAGVRIITQ